MALHTQPDQEYQGLPSCFDELPRGLTKELAKEIYETLLSLQKLRPEPVRTSGPSSCPAARLGRRKSRYIVERVLQGGRFKILDEVESKNVRFIGPMAGVIEAVNLGAVDDVLKALFFNRIQKLVSTLSTSKIASVRGIRVTRQFWTRIRGDERLGTGLPTLEKLHGCWIQLARASDITTVAMLRVIDVEFHPEQY